MRLRPAALLLVLLAITGCYAPAFPQGLPCSESGACPPAQSCDEARDVCVADVMPIDSGASPIDAPAAVGPATMISLGSGDGQSGPAGSALAAPFIVTVEDASSQPVAGVEVAFIVTTGGGEVSVESMDTNSLGEAQTTLTLGAAFGSNTVEARAAGLSGSPVVFTAVSVVPPSCAGPGLMCGQSNDSCCASPLVLGGDYARSHDVGTDGAYPDMSFPAMVSTFRLDRYEVTVGRFRAFVNAGMGTQASPPGEGAGAHASLAGSGWLASFTGGLPVDTPALKTALGSCSAFGSWTDASGVNERRPMNCITWYEAMAFCAWDGGFLPTEAEWNYAAVGGTEYRAFPWSSPQTGGFGSLIIDCTFANYDACDGATNDVGSKSPGDGKWQQSDLAGNVWEWTIDWYAPYANPCTDCANLAENQGRVFRGGGFSNAASNLRGAYRSGLPPATRPLSVGVRCARAP